MIDWQLLSAVFIGVIILLSMILKLKIHPFLALLISSITVGICAGMNPDLVFQTLVSGIGGTLGFVATIVGLGSIMGAMLDKSGGAASLANWMINIGGEKKASWAMMFAGFLIAIPVFFDVAFIILLPMAVALKRKTNKPILLYALPLLAGLAITHAFIPPTPGPVAVAEILKADIGWVILFGFIIGLPAAIISGPLFARYISKKVVAIEQKETLTKPIVADPPSPIAILFIILLPISLVVSQTIISSNAIVSDNLPEIFLKIFATIGHPFSALIIANLVAWYFLGIRKGVKTNELLDISSSSFRQAGAIILLTGAGGGFKQILIETGAGTMIAESLGATSMSPVVFCFIIAAIVRVMQGSSTVAMITAAGFTAPLLSFYTISEYQLAIMVVAIASGATVVSHVNDSGFWLVKEYLNLNEKQTFRTWTLMTTLIGVVGFTLSLILFLFI